MTEKSRHSPVKGWKYLVDLDEVMIYFCGYGGE